MRLGNRGGGAPILRGATAALLVAGLALSAGCTQQVSGQASKASELSITSVPRATAATSTPDERLSDVVRKFDEQGIPHQGREWIAERAVEVCADWEEVGAESGFAYASMKQMLNFRPIDERSVIAVVILTHMSCPQWAIYIN